MKRGSKEDILKTIKKGYLEIFIENTRLSGSDLIFLMLEAIENTLMTVSEIEEDNQKNIAMGLIRKEGIPEWIISLQEHPDEKIYNLSYKILDKFFDCEENKI